MFMVGTHQDQSQRQGVSKNTSVCVQVGGRLVQSYARLPGSCVAKDPEATGSCRVHFEASDRVRQRRLGTFTSQGQETHRTRTGYPGAHRALFAKNVRTVLRTQRRFPAFFLQVPGRWGSATIQRYVADALAEKASLAPLAAEQDWDTSDILGAMGTQGGAGTSVHALSGWIKQCVRTELRAHGTEAHGMTQALETQVHARSDCVAHGAQHLGGGDQGADRVEHPAEHREHPGQAGGDEVRPVDVVGERAIRTTRTGVVHLVRLGRQRFTHLAGWSGVAGDLPPGCMRIAASTISLA